MPRPTPFPYPTLFRSIEVQKASILPTHRIIEEPAHRHWIVGVKAEAIPGITNTDHDLIDTRLNCFGDIDIKIHKRLLFKSTQLSVDIDSGVEVVLGEFDKERASRHIGWNFNARAIPDAMR